MYSSCQALVRNSRHLIPNRNFCFPPSDPLPFRPWPHRPVSRLLGKELAKANRPAPSPFCKPITRTCLLLLTRSDELHDSKCCYLFGYCCTYIHTCLVWPRLASVRRPRWGVEEKEMEEVSLRRS